MKLVKLICNELIIALIILVRLHMLIILFTFQGTHTTLKLDPPNGLYTSTNQVPRSIAVAQTYNPPKLDGILQPAATMKLPLGNGSAQLGEGGPIRHRQSRPANERPSPVAFDGKYATMVDRHVLVSIVSVRVAPLVIDFYTLKYFCVVS